MNVFVSWSGQRGRVFAEAVCRLMATTGEGGLEPWMSTQIRHGRPWAAELLAQLGQCHACIVCVTADTLASRWLAFEAGAVLGVGADPDHVVCLGLDLEPGMLDERLLARFRSFDTSPDGMRALWRSLLPGSEGTWSEAAWQMFERACAAVPDARPAPFTLWLQMQGALTAHPVQVEHDMAFDDVLAQLLEWHGDHSDAQQRGALRCLDIDSHRWVPMPRRLSMVNARRLAILDADAVENYQDSSRLAALQLHEAIDVAPQVNASIASLRRDLRDLVAMQTTFHATHQHYAQSVEELEFLPARGNDIQIAAGEHGFAAVANSDQLYPGFGVRVGDGAGQFAGQADGEIFMLSAR